MRPLLLAQSDLQGGAARAAFRLHKAMHGAGHESEMLVRDRYSDFPNVRVLPSSVSSRAVAALRSQFGGAIFRLGCSSIGAPRSGNWIPSRVLPVIESYSPDVVNIHWIGGETMSIAEIGRIKRPVVWTVHDMWLFCGSEHYTTDSEDSRWRSGYTADPGTRAELGFDLDRWVWARKKKRWRMPMSVVAPSKWLAKCASASALLREQVVTCIPNPLDTDCFAPRNRAFSREVFGLPEHGFLIAFGAISGQSDPRKGFDLLRGALSHVRAAYPEIPLHAVVFGQSAPVGAELPVPVKWLGHLHDDASLSLLYSAVDVAVVPSRQENLPQSATEAQACGCPVLAFDCTGLSDAVAHMETGYLARPFDVADMAAGVKWLHEDRERLAVMRHNARDRALQLWSPNVVIPQYVEFYERAIERHRQIR